MAFYFKFSERQATLLTTEMRQFAKDAGVSFNYRGIKGFGLYHRGYSDPTVADVPDSEMSALMTEIENGGYTITRPLTEEEALDGYGRKSSKV